jgi:hypothetical protein
MWVIVALALYFAGPVAAQVRVFMAVDGSEGTAATTGPTSLAMPAGSTTTVSVWLDDDSPSQPLNSYQVILDWVADGGCFSQGTVRYDDDGSLGGGSVVIDAVRSDFVFNGLGIGGPVYNETAPPPTAFSGFGFIGSRAGINDGVNASTGPRYLGAFDLVASAQACGSFELKFIPLGGVPAGGSSFAQPGGGQAYDIDEYQNLVVVIGGSDPEDLDDCNANGVFDGCDIAQGVSADVDANGVPDECITTTSTGDWSADIWGLGGPNPYPDDSSGEADLHVTLDGADITLDLSVDIDSLRLINGAILRLNDTVTSTDLTIDGNGVVEQSVVEVDSDHIITLGGTLHLRDSGVFRPVGGHVIPLSASLQAGGIVIDEGTLGGALELVSQMTAHSLGLLHCDGLTKAAGGSGAPPVVSVVDDAVLRAETWVIDRTVAGEVSSSVAVELSRALTVHTTEGVDFDWVSGDLTFDPLGAGPAPMAIEAAGVDRGPTGDGFLSNHAVNTLEVLDGSHVTFADQFDNDGFGQVAFTEALYVDTLILRSGSVITLVDAHIYYRTLVLEAAIVDPASTGSLIKLCSAAPCCDTDSNFIRDDACQWCVCADDICTPQSTEFADLGGGFGLCPPDEFVNIHDRTHVLTCFDLTNPCDSINIDAGGQFGNCQPDGFCNLHDVNHVVSTFAGTSTCGCGPTPQFPSAPPAESAGIVLAGPRSTRPGGRFDVIASLDRSLVDLQSYQLAIDATGGRAGHLRVVNVRLPDYGVLAAAADLFEAYNIPFGAMMAGLSMGGVQAPAGAELAIFTFEASPDATGVFVIDEGHTHAGYRSALVGSNQAEIDLHRAKPLLVTVSPGRQR